MKKLFTLTAAVLVALGASAQEGTVTPKIAKKLDNTLVFYTTNDTVTSKLGISLDEETGEEIEAMVPAPWNGGIMVNAFNQCGIPLTGAPTDEQNYRIFTRNDYKDERTGFEMPAGAYRGMMVQNGTFGLTGALGTDKIIGYSNVKSMVLYVIPIPVTIDLLTPGSTINHSALFTGRVQARYVDAEGNHLSNRAYREVQMDMIADPERSVSDNGTPFPDDDYVTRDIRGTNLMNFARDVKKPLDVVVDQPFRIEVNLQNIEDGVAYTDLLRSDRREFVNLKVADTDKEAFMSYYFADKATSRPYEDNETSGDCTSGYDNFTGKWAEKIVWSPETIVQLEVKKLLYIVGFSLVSATEGATSKFMNAADDFNAAWSDSAKAYGNHGASLTLGIDEVTTVDTPADNVMYNVAGQIVGENYKGLVIKNGKKMVIK